MTKNRVMNFMKIRVRSPDPKNWYSIKKAQKMYYRVPEGQGTKFYTLQSKRGRFNQVKGVPRGRNFKRFGEGKVVPFQYHMVQAFRIPYSALGITARTDPKRQAEIAKKQFGDDMIRALNAQKQLPIKVLDVNIYFKGPAPNEFGLRVVT